MNTAESATIVVLPQRGIEQVATAQFAAIVILPQCVLRMSFSRASTFCQRFNWVANEFTASSSTVIDEPGLRTEWRGLQWSSV